MKPSLTKEYTFTGNLFKYRLVTSADGTVTNKEYDVVPTEVTMSLSVSLIGELLIDSTYKMQKNAIVTDIKDRNGDEIYEDGVWEIIQTAPLISPLGTKEGYKYRAIILRGDV